MASTRAGRMERFDEVIGRLFPVALGAIVVAGFFARLATWVNVFTREGIALKLTDSHYYVRFALLQLESFPRFEAFDPFINHPTGAHIIWPPLHTWLLSVTIALFGEDRAQLAAAWLGPIVSVLHLLVVALLVRRWFGAALSLGVTFTLALLPVCAESGALGNADHHVHEPVLMALSILSVAHALRTGARRDAVVAGVIMGLGRFFTTVSFLVFPLAAAGLVLWALGSSERARTVTRVSAVAAITAAPLLYMGALLFGLPLSIQYEAFSAFHALIAGATLGGASAIAALRAGERRAFAIASAASVVLLTPVVLGMVRAAQHLGRKDPLLAAVTESFPLYADPGWALELFSLPLLLSPLVLFGIVVAARRGSEVGLLTCVFIFPLIAAAVAQVRFTQPLSGAFALALPVGLAALAEPMSKTLRSVMALAALAVALVTAYLSLHPDEPAGGYDASVLARPTLEWMRDHTPPPAPPEHRYDPDAQPAYAVISRFDFGHLIALWAQRPVVASPFGQAPWHQAGNARASDVLAATTDEEAHAHARATGARYVLASPFGPILGREDVKREQTLAHRLLEEAGLGGGDRDGSAHFRLLRDSKEQRYRKEGGAFARLFEVVDGAVLRGHAAPGAEVVATLQLENNLGKALRYVRRAKADDAGRFSLRVAHPTDVTREGEVRALGPYQIEAAGQAWQVAVTEAQVRSGHSVPLEQ